jgi:hypothetical protein
VTLSSGVLNLFGQTLGHRRNLAQIQRQHRWLWGKTRVQNHRCCTPGPCMTLIPLLAFITKTSTQGVDAEYVSLENVVPPYDGVDSTLGQDFYDLIGTAFATRVRECGPRVPVVTGTCSFLPPSARSRVCHRLFQPLTRLVTETSGSRIHRSGGRASGSRPRCI